MNVFFNMGVILLNAVGFALTILLSLIMVFAPIILGFIWYILIAVVLADKVGKYQKLWKTLGVLVGFLVTLFLYSFIFTVMPMSFWLDPWFPGDAWLGGFR